MFQSPIAKPTGWKKWRGWLVGVPVSIGIFTTLIIVNFSQTASLVLYPFSRKAFRRFNRGCATFFWGLCVTASKVVNGVQVVVSGDAIPDRENVMVVCNHQQMPDILALMFLAKDKHRVGDMKWFVKNAIKYTPGVGWGMQFLDCLFLKRNWESDHDYIESKFSKFKNFKIPVWLMSFSEGTRLTPKKLALSQEYARKAGIWEPKHVLIPRTKGFVASIEGLRDYLDAVYDATLAYPEGVPTLMQYFMGLTPVIYLHVRRHPLASLPQDPKVLSDWLMERFREKDQLLNRFSQTGSF